jgi:hypothetical protein
MVVVEMVKQKLAVGKNERKQGRKNCVKSSNAG